MADKIKNFLRSLSWLHVLLALLAIGALRYFGLDQGGLQNRRDQVVEMRSKIVDLNKKIEEAKQFELEFEKRKKKYAEMKQQFQSMQGALPKEFYLPDVLNDLIQETKLVDLEISSISPDQREEKKELYSSLGVTVDARGSFLQLLVLLDRLSTMKRLVGVNSISLTKDTSIPNKEIVVSETKMGSFPMLKVKIKLVAYRYGG